MQSASADIVLPSTAKLIDAKASPSRDGAGLLAYVLCTEMKGNRPNP